jgi:Protein of unknown function (DUF998)
MKLRVKGEENVMKAPVKGSFELVRLYSLIRQTRVHTALLISGIACSLIWLGSDILAAWRYTGYNYPFDPISYLSAVDSPVRSLTTPLSIIYLVLKIMFTFGVWVSAGKQRKLRVLAGLMLAFVLADLASYFFPLHPNEPISTMINLMHAILAGGVSVLLILLIIGFGASAGGKWFRVYSYATLLVMFVMGVLPLLSGFKITIDQIPKWFGAGERINAYGFMLWMMVLAVVLLRIQPKNHQEHNIEELAEHVLPPSEI